MLPSKVKKSFLLFVIGLKESERKEAHLSKKISLILTTYWPSQVPIISKWQPWHLSKNYTSKNPMFRYCPRFTCINVYVCTMYTYLWQKMRQEDAWNSYIWTNCPFFSTQIEANSYNISRIIFRVNSRWIRDKCRVWRVGQGLNQTKLTIYNQLLTTCWRYLDTSDWSANSSRVTFPPG